MNKVVVGVSPSPNISKTSSKIGSLANSSYKPGGGQVKIENRKLEWNAAPRTKTVNKDYTPGGGDKKVRELILVMIDLNSDVLLLLSRSKPFYVFLGFLLTIL